MNGGYRPHITEQATIVRPAAPVSSGSSEKIFWLQVSEVICHRGLAIPFAAQYHPLSRKRCV